jgi:hypothetical protein
MRRREFIGGLAGTAAWPLVARALQPDRIMRLGLLDVGFPIGVKVFLERLAQLGWTEGRSLRIDHR